MKKAFEPLSIMGIFWSAFGVIVLIATFFVRGTPQVPLSRGIITNIIAGVLLLGAGVFSFLKGRANRRQNLSKS